MKLFSACTSTELFLSALNAETPDLNLSVTAADELDVSVRKPAYDISRPVYACRFGIKWIFRKDLSCFIRPAQITVANLRAGDPQLTGHAGRNPAPPVVNNIQFQVVQRLADGIVDLSAAHLVDGAKDGGFRRSVAIKEAVTRRFRSECHGRQFFSADEEILKTRFFYFSGKLPADLGRHE